VQRLQRSQRRNACGFCSKEARTEPQAAEAGLSQGRQIVFRPSTFRAHHQRRFVLQFEFARIGATLRIERETDALVGGNGDRPSASLFAEGFDA
jgi:hypothetical protein